ncbi:MAG TPA: protease modulator HflK [Kiritimatiellia bacterium]|nr:protease modulator HflK [Kiritimatiellia bacterium]HMP00446.1 protease modulator HflK [Kiritimatiellia bacterium]HMP97653.1 protease modulator HflK [Kiritimatiellia bacterium]
MTEETPTTESNLGLAALSDALRRSFTLLRRLMLLLVAGYLASGVFMLRQHERGIVLRFGKIAGVGDARILEPGLHWTWPKPFSEIVRIPAGRVESLTSVVFWTGESEATRLDPPPTLRPLLDGYTLAGDANLLHSQWAVRYTVDDPEAFLFRVQQPAALMERELNRAVLLVSARHPVDALLRTDLEGFRRQVEQEFRTRLTAFNLGARIQGVDVLNIAPPLQVADAFDQVIRAEQEQAQDITDARAYASRTLNEARGQADQIIAEGATYQSRLVNALKADADTFRQMAPSVARQPVLMRHILWQDTIRAALGSVGQLYVVPADEHGKREVRLQLSPRRQNPFAEAMP